MLDNPLPTKLIPYLNVVRFNSSPPASQWYWRLSPSRAALCQRLGLLQSCTGTCESWIGLLRTLQSRSGSSDRRRAVSRVVLGNPRRARAGDALRSSRSATWSRWGRAGSAAWPLSRTRRLLWAPGKKIITLFLFKLTGYWYDPS